MKLTKGQARLLAMCPDKRFEFMKTSAQERNAFDMYRAGLLERRSEVYSMKRGGSTVEMRWAYRRTLAGRLAANPPTEPDPGPPEGGKDFTGCDV